MQLKTRSYRTVGVILVIVSAVVFSSAGLFVKGVSADSWVILFWRGLFAAIFTTCYIGWQRTLQYEFRDMGWPGIAAGAIGAAATVAFIPSFKFTSIANVSLIYAACPFVAAAIAWLWMREKPSRGIVVCSVMAFMGVAIIVGGSLGGVNFFGDLLALWMTIGMAGYLCVYRHYPSTPAAGPAVLLSIILVPVGWLFGDPLSAPLSEIIIMAIFGLVFSVASVTIAEGAKRLPAPETALLSALEIPLAPVWAYFLFSEVPVLFTVAGGIVILIAVVASQVSPQSSKKVATSS